MNGKWLAYISLIFGLALSSQAALRFTNVTPIVTVPLNGVAYDGFNTMVAVGDNSTVTTAKFVTSGLQLGSTWGVTNVPTAALLKSLTYGAGMFMAGGTNSAIFRSTDGSSWGPTNSAFQNPASVQGLAYNADRFAAVASVVNISWSSNALASWQDAAIANASFLESYRGVTAFGTNGFAVCGIRGVIRISRDAGENWSVVRPFNLNEPDLLGIASDGGQRLVAVGAGGRTMVSTDGGTNWTINSVGITNRAVAYSGSDFIMVGDGGQIFASTDGVSWSPQSNGLPAGFSTNLLGLAVATSGQLQGITVLVGEGGAIVIGGTEPVAPTSLGDQTNCAAYPNPTLMVSVTDPAILTVDWYGSTAGGSPVAVGTLNFTPANTAPGTHTFYAETRDLRTGFTSTNRTPVSLTLNPRPTAVVSGDGVICNGFSNQITATLGGSVGPWNVTWSDGIVQNNVTSPATRFVNPNTTTIYTVVALNDTVTGCTNEVGGLTGSATVTVNPRPTAVVSGDGVICNGFSNQITATLGGSVGPWNVTWSDGVIQNGATSPAMRFVNPNTTTVYTVVGLNDAVTGCTNEVGGLTGSATVTVNPRPTAVVSGNGVICNGFSNQITATLGGSVGPWNVTWSDGIVQNNVTSPATRFVNPNTTTVYTVVALNDAVTGCTNEVDGLTGSATVAVNPRPTAVVSGDGVICNGFSNQITATLGGSVGPWNVTWSDGVIQNGATSPATRFVNPNTTTVFTVVALNDAVTGCTNEVGGLTGSATVTVNPRPTAVVSGDGTICSGSSNQITATLGGSAGPWNVTWSDGVIQNGATSPATRFVNPNTTTAYTVVALNDAVTGCTNEVGGLTGSATVTVNPRPTAVVSGDGTICSGSSNQITATLGGSAGPWNVTWSDGVIQNGVTSPATRLVGPAVTTVYTVTALSDANTGCTNEAGGLTGSATVTLNPTPAAPVSLGDQIGCAGVTNPPLSVTVSAGVTADWYAAASGGSALAMGVTSFTPTNSAAGDHIYYAEARDTASGCISTNRTAVTLTLESCTGALTVSRLDTNNVVLEWFGNLGLQSTPALELPIVWTHVTDGAAGVTNRWTNSVAPPPVNHFFRLYAPTNSP
ncbi:MAG: hypothetical protein IH623_11500 [Verrucomicrobia bacterium]|nr:hypothetical protein [Verrucomicrobiota bacterium]